MAIEALLNLGVKLKDLPKSSVQENSEWLKIYLKGKSNLINREYKEAIKTFKAIDTSVIFLLYLSILSNLNLSI